MNLIMTIIGRVFYWLLSPLFWTTGITRYADVSTLINDIYEGAFFTLKSGGRIIQTVTVFTDEQGVNPRKFTKYGDGNIRQLAEGEDRTPTQLSRTLLATLTPLFFGDQFFMTDQDIRTNPENQRVNGARILGANTAQYLDTQLAGNFSEFTGGTVGTAGGTLTWSNILAAQAKLHQARVPGPYFCALGVGQWYHLKNNSGSINVSFDKSEEFNDLLVAASFQESSLLPEVTFVISPDVSGAAGTAAYGGLYNSMALAFDEREAFSIEPQRDASRQGWELNSNIWFAHDAVQVTYGVQLIGTDVIA